MSWEKGGRERVRRLIRRGAAAKGEIEEAPLDEDG